MLLPTVTNGRIPCVPDPIAAAASFHPAAVATMSAMGQGWVSAALYVYPGPKHSMERWGSMALYDVSWAPCTMAFVAG